VVVGIAAEIGTDGNRACRDIVRRESDCSNVVLTRELSMAVPSFWLFLL
jgi:hypothetical protein